MQILGIPTLFVLCQELRISIWERYEQKLWSLFYGRRN